MANSNQIILSYELCQFYPRCILCCFSERVNEKEPTNTTLQILIQQRYVWLVWTFCLSVFHVFYTTLTYSSLSSSMDLSMGTIKLTLCGREQGNSPRASSSSGQYSLKKYMCVCIWTIIKVSGSSVMIHLAAHDSDTYQIYKSAFV